MLLHGFGGWDTILGSLEYFYGVEDDLESRGYDVWVPISDAVNDTPTRARQYAEQLDEILATTHARKVNFVTHSQGGLDARYLVSTLGYGDRVGAVVMISTVSPLRRRYLKGSSCPFTRAPEQWCPISE